MKTITILGATGSIGQQTLDIIRRHPHRFQVFALSARQNYPLLFQAAKEFHPQYLVVESPSAAMELQKLLDQQRLTTKVLVGEEGLCEIVSDKQVDMVMAAIVGAAGLLPTLKAAETGKTILLANKEALVMAGELFIRTCQQNQAQLIPVDSEHSAVYQCLVSRSQPIVLNQISEIILTASGGPFRTRALEEFAHITPEEACKHPNWVMGQKVTVDSATMFNKALEVIEAHWLFGLPVEKIKVLIHPQSIIHSMVSFIDGSTMAQMGQPDMRTPIAYALSQGERIESGVQPLDWMQIRRLDFEKVDLKRFPSVGLAYQALAMGGTASTILNAANEVAVSAFLQKQIRFDEIFKIVQQVLENTAIKKADNLSMILQADSDSRLAAKSICQILENQLN